MIRHLADDVEQPGLDQRLVRQIVGSHRSALHQIERGQLPGRQIAGVCRPEQLQQEFCDASRFRQCPLGAVALTCRTSFLHDGDTQSRGERRNHDDDRRGFQPMAAQELARPIAADAAVRLDRQARQMTLEVLPQLSAEA